MSWFNNINLPDGAKTAIGDEQFGVPNDGIQDAAPALQAAIDEVSAAGEYSILQLRPGTYLLGATIIHAPNVHVCGAGKESTIIRQAPSAPTPLWRFVVGNAAISRTALSDVTIQGTGDSSLTSAAARTGTGISLTSCLFTHIFNVNVWDFVIGIDVNDGSASVNFSAYNKVGPEMEVNRCTTGIRALANANGNRFEDVRVFFSFGDVDEGIGVDVDNAAALTFDGCQFESCDTCMRVRNSGGYPANQELQLVVEGCYFEPGINIYTTTVGTSYDIEIIESAVNISSDIVQLCFRGNRYSGQSGTAIIPVESLSEFDGYMKPFFGPRVDGTALARRNYVQNGQVLNWNAANIPGWATAGAPTLTEDVVTFVTGVRSLSAVATTVPDQVGVSFIVSDECEWITFGFRYQVVLGTSLIIVGQSGAGNLVQYPDLVLSAGVWQVGYVTVRRDVTSNAAALSFALLEVGAEILIDEIWAFSGRYAATPTQYGQRIELLPAPIKIAGETAQTTNRVWGPINILDLPTAPGGAVGAFAAAPRGVVGGIIRLSMTVTNSPAGLLTNFHRVYLDIPAATPVAAGFGWLFAVYGLHEHTIDYTVLDTTISGGTGVGDGFQYDYEVELVAWVLE